MIPVFNSRSQLLDVMATLPVRGRDIGHHGGRRACVLVYDEARDLALICYRMRWEPLEEVICATLEQDTEKQEARRSSAQPFMALVDSPRVQWLSEHPNTVRTGIFTISEETELMQEIEHLRDWVPYYAWVKRQILSEMVEGGTRMSEGLIRATTILSLQVPK